MRRFPKPAPASGPLADAALLLGTLLVGLPSPVARAAGWVLYAAAILPCPQRALAPLAFWAPSFDLPAGFVPIGFTLKPAQGVAILAGAALAWTAARGRARINLGPIERRAGLFLLVSVVSALAVADAADHLRVTASLALSIGTGLAARQFPAAARRRGLAAWGIGTAMTFLTFLLLWCRGLDPTGTHGASWSFAYFRIPAVLAIPIAFLAALRGGRAWTALFLAAWSVGLLILAKSVLVAGAVGAAAGLAALHRAGAAMSPGRAVRLALLATAATLLLAIAVRDVRTELTDFAYLVVPGDRPETHQPRKSRTQEIAWQLGGVRTTGLRGTARSALDHPVLGIGPAGQFAHSSHNLLLHVAGTTGFVGLAIFLSIFTAAGRALCSGLRDDPARAALGMAVLAAWALYAQFEIPLHPFLPWFLLGLACADPPDAPGTQA